MLNVQIVLFDGFDLLDAIAPYEVFCAAAMYAENSLHVELVTTEGPRSVPSGINGLRIEASSRLDPEREAIILVPGASGDAEGDGPDSVPALLRRAMETELTGMIGQALQHDDRIIAAVHWCLPWAAFWKADRRRRNFRTGCSTISGGTGAWAPYHARG